MNMASLWLLARHWTLLLSSRSVWLLARCLPRGLAWAVRCMTGRLSLMVCWGWRVLPTQQLRFAPFDIAGWSQWCSLRTPARSAP